jgi:hypothetical protein
MILMMATALFSQTAQHSNRITQELSSGGMVRMSGTVHPLTRRATDLGALDAGMRLEGLTLSALPDANGQKELKTLLVAQQDSKSPLYHKWLTQEEYGTRFGLTEADLGRLTGWLESQGFTVQSVAPSRNLITFSGTAGQVNTAFQTKMHEYKFDGETRICNATEIALPRGMASVVTRVGGLNGFMRPKAQARRATAQFTASESGAHYLTPADWATIYDVNPIYLAGYTGTGMHVGVVGQSYIPQADVDSFRAASNLGPTLLNYVCISSSNCATTAGENLAQAAGESISDLAEADLDVEWAGGIAPNATVDYIYTSATDTTHGALDALAYAITTYQIGGSTVPVLSASYGECELQLALLPNYQTEIDGLLAEAAAQGQTVLIASGDMGAGCSAQTPYNVAENGAAVNWPASSPLVTAVGGTRFSGDGTDTYGDAYWSGSNGADILSSAQKYIPEISWNDTAANQVADPLAPMAASGGGVSILYAPPVWQQTLAPLDTTGNPITSPMRFVPDVAFTASANHDGYLICTPEFPGNASLGSQTTGGSCLNNTFRDLDNHVTPVGGTSASTASFAGVVTLLVQKYGRQGNLAPALYGLANNGGLYSQVFHDVKSGNNNIPCSTLQNGCLNNTVGYPASTGFDLVTGLGSIDANAMFTNYVTDLAQSVTTVAATPNSLIMGGTTNLTATVASTTPGTIDGSVTFLLGGVKLGTVNSLVQSSTANESIATASLGVAVSQLIGAQTGFTTGQNVITASYSGSAQYAPSSGNTTVAALAIPTAITLKTTLNSVALGDVNAQNTFSFVATVTGNGTPLNNGTVQFYVGAVAVGSPVISDLQDGVYHLNYVSPTTGNGFVVGSDTVTATFTPLAGQPYGVATATANVTVTAPAYTLTPASTTITLHAGESQTVTVNLTSTTFQDTVALTLLPSSPAIMASIPSSYTKFPVSASDHAYVALTIQATAVAANRAPALPWTGGMIAFGAVLAGVPLARRRKRVAAVLLAALTITGLLFTMSCGSTTPRNYTVQVLGTGGVSTVVNVVVK